MRGITRTLLLKLAESTREFVAVILGVLGAFWLSSWAESRGEARLEQFYIEELRDNLALDEVQITTVIEAQANRRENLSGLLETMATTTEADKPRFDSLFTATIANETFFPAMGAYRAMVSEGSLDLVSDKELVTSLVELYEFYYGRLIYLGTVLDEEVARATWENREYYSLYSGRFHDVEAIRSPGFRSTQEHRWGFITLYLDHARQTEEKLREVRAQLEDEIERRR